jgi:hypothetical protein
MKTLETTIDELIEKFDELLNVQGPGGKPNPNYPMAKGFTIRKGKTLFWYTGITSKNGGKYTCYPRITDPNNPGCVEVGAPRYILPGTSVTIHFPTKKYCLYNWDEKKEIVIGEFVNDDEAWEAVKKMVLPQGEIWHLSSF